MVASKYTLLKEEYIQSVGGVAKLWEHTKTKAQVLSICNDDENKSFGVTFRTPANNSTGVAHILEHSVLCGSKKYPAKAPFTVLLKSSMQTFLNAITYPDKTVYLAASTNLQDFYNLIDVYLDAVFFPCINEEVFYQEGWHVHAEDEDISNWHFKGVVFNEMKGVYSSPDCVLGEKTQHAVFPDNIYGFDAGGNPENILDLTYEEFKNFHTSHYHASNARFFFWGDDPEDERLIRLAEILDTFDRGEPTPVAELQKYLHYDHKIEAFYAAEEDEAEEDEDDEKFTETREDEDIGYSEDEARTKKDAHVTVSWLLCEGSNSEEIMLLRILQLILIGLPGAPLCQALLDSRIGEDMTGCGLDTDLRQAYFSIGLRSISSNDADTVERLIMDTLAKMVEDGVNQQAITSALSTMEFSLRENNTGDFPRGLSAMTQSLSTWLYGEDPFAPLMWEKSLENIKKRLALGERVFENAIQKWFLENTHRVCLALLPCENLARARKERESTRLAHMTEALSGAEKKRIIEITKKLTDRQIIEDTPESLASLPSLKLDDIPKKGKEKNLGIVESGDITVLHHDVDTAGILYVKILFPLHNISQEEFPLLTLYCRSLTEMGTKKRDIADLGFEISTQTGELNTGTVIRTKINDGEPLMYLTISAKVLEEKIPILCDLIREVITEPNFSRQERFVQMAWENKSRYELSIIPAGNMVLASYLNGMLSKTGFMNELTNGIPYWNYIRKLPKIAEENYAEMEAKLQSLHKKIICLGKLILSFTGAASLLKKSMCFEDLMRSLPRDINKKAVYSYTLKEQATGFIVPAQVNCVGLGGNLKGTGYTHNGSVHVITHFLRLGYLWNTVRLQGGAYGCLINYTKETGNLNFISYRDPNIEDTFNIYRSMADYLGNLHLTQAEVTKSIIGVIAGIDAYKLPFAKGDAALWDYMSNYTKEMQAKFRDEIFSTSLADFHNFAPYLQKFLDNSIPVALGGTAVSDYGAKENWELIKLL